MLALFSSKPTALICSSFEKHLACREHLVTGPCASDSFEGSLQEIITRVDETLDAAARAVSNTIKAHVRDHIKALTASLFRDAEMRYR